MSKRIEVMHNGQAAAQARSEQRRAEAASGIRIARRLQPYVPFPVAALPEPIRSYAVERALALGCDIAYVALPALAAAAGLIGSTRLIELRRSWREPCVIWTAVIADSGTLKTPAHAGAVGHLYTMERRLTDQYERERAAHDTVLTQWTADAKRAKEQGAQPPTKPEQPRRQRVVCSDITIETLAEVLADNPRGTLLARDELAGWLGSFTRYKGKSGGSDLPLWLSAHGAGHWQVDRKTGDRRSLFVERAAVSVCGTIQPGVLARLLTDEHQDAGLTARLLMAMPPKLPKRWTELIVSPETEDRYTGLLDALHRLDFAGDVPHVLTLGIGSDARAAWIDYYGEWAQRQAAAHDELAACYAKIEAYAARLALLHHVVTHVGLECSDLCQVGTVSVTAGITLARWFAVEAERVYAMLAEDTSTRTTRRLVEWITGRGGAVTVKELQRSSRRYEAAEQAKAMLDALVEGGLGAWEDRPPTARGGRPTRVFRLALPRADETDETPDGRGDAYEGGADETA